MNLQFSTTVSAPFETVTKNFDIELLTFLSPYFPIVKINRYDGNKVSDIIEIHLGFVLFNWEWISQISEFKADSRQWYFIDKGIQLPPFLKSWEHKHEVLNTGDQSVIIDDIQFEPARFWPGLIVKFILWIQFSQRGPLYKKYFGRKIDQK